MAWPSLSPYSSNCIERTSSAIHAVGSTRLLEVIRGYNDPKVHFSAALEEKTEIKLTLSQLAS